MIEGLEVAKRIVLKEIDKWRQLCNLPFVDELTKEQYRGGRDAANSILYLLEFELTNEKRTSQDLAEVSDED